MAGFQILLLLPPLVVVLLRFHVKMTLVDKARGTPGVPILFACKLDTQSHAEAHSGGRSTNCWQRDADKAMMGPPREMPSRLSASRFLSSDKAERSSSAPPRSFRRTCCDQSLEIDDTESGRSSINCEAG
ncbi:unnamed protein product [Caenorhabditis auriculariae]|uniref:Secreted protein n=1 Tax=Caenorhabditis auriculariae TaxID=2777116 RepID=A0A8S1HLS2_9PELO|nr:unnamed protein product [Caenorhabditis auriculariae]